MAIIFLGALAGMAISATIGSTVLLLGGAISQSQFPSTWAVWWTGDAMGVLLVAPFLLSIFALGAPPRLTLRTALEITGLLVATAVITYLLFLNELRLNYLVLPLIMLAAWRFRLRGAAPAALVASGVAIVCAVNGLGPFAEETLFEKMVTLQVFNVSLALTSFVLVSFIETRKRREEISRLYASAEAANQAKSRFLHLAAHELRPPITVIPGYLTMLSDGTLGPAPNGWKQPLTVLAAKARELNRLVSDLLEASRTEANAVRTVTERLDLREVVQEAVERARPRADLVGAEVAIHLPAQPAIVEADAAQVGRILDNLINNAMTYNLSSPRVQVTISAHNDRAAVRVADNGVGIAPPEREPIFEQFHRTNEPSFMNVPGTGLGLYISRQLAEANGGTLTLESSSPPAGTVFLLLLPAVPTTAEVAAADDALASLGQRVAPTRWQASSARP